MDIAEKEHAYVITMELPGMSAGSVNVEVDDGVLEMRGEKRDEREEEDEKRHYVERTYGSFVRSFRLPANADADGVNAKFRDGVLHVEIPKTEESKPKVVSVQS
jgi:HSP20 family protein